MKKLIQVFGASVSGSKTNLQAIRVLVNLVNNKKIASMFLELGFYEALFQNIENTTDPETLGEVILLFICIIALSRFL